MSRHPLQDRAAVAAKHVGRSHRLCEEAHHGLHQGELEADEALHKARQKWCAAPMRPRWRAKSDMTRPSLALATLLYEQVQCIFKRLARAVMVPQMP